MRKRLQSPLQGTRCIANVEKNSISLLWLFFWKHVWAARISQLCAGESHKGRECSAALARMGREPSRACMSAHVHVHEATLMFSLCDAMASCSWAQDLTHRKSFISVNNHDEGTLLSLCSGAARHRFGQQMCRSRGKEHRTRGITGHGGVRKGFALGVGK